MILDIFQSSDFVTVLGLVAGVISALSTLPQLIRTYKLKKASHISAVMICVLLFAILLWLVYGYLKKDIAILVNNGISLILNSTLLYFRWKYKDAKDDEKQA